MLVFKFPRCVTTWRYRTIRRNFGCRYTMLGGVGGGLVPVVRRCPGCLRRCTSIVSVRSLATAPSFSNVYEDEPHQLTRTVADQLQLPLIPVSSRSVLSVESPRHFYGLLKVSYCCDCANTDKNSASQVAHLHFHAVCRQGRT